MKKIFSLLFISVLVLQANAQIEKPITKGSFRVGGSFDFSIDKSNYVTDDGLIAVEREHTIFEGTIGFGYFIFNKFSIGIELDYIINRTDYGQSISTSDEVIIGPTIRYYTKVGIFAKGAVEFGYYYWGPKIDQIKYRNFLWDIGIGYSLFLNKNIALESIVSYSELRKTAIEKDYSDREIRGFNMTIGFQIYFNGPRNDQINN